MIVRIIEKIESIWCYFKFLFRENVNIKRNINIELGSEMEILNGSKVKIGNKFILKRNSCIRCRNDSELIIGNNVGFNNGCILTCRKKISIGNNVIIGPNVMIFDHDHNYKSDNMMENFICGEIHIGNNVWIGANSIILKGSIIGDNCVIAAGSIVRNRIEANTVFYNEVKNKTKNIL